jgi:hypothetical protein
MQCSPDTSILYLSLNSYIDASTTQDYPTY